MTQLSFVQVAGHFGELLQGRLGPKGPLALISLPCAVLTVTAAQRPGRNLVVRGAGLVSPQRARQFLAGIGLQLRAPVQMTADMPIGGGAGSSTAALVALARLAGWQGHPMDLARACLASEGATDPLMFARAERMLWASRQAELLDPMPALPGFEVVGGFFGPAQRTDPADMRFADVSDLLDDWSAAALSGDLGRLATLASVSAGRTLRLRDMACDPITELARQTGALGYVIAHTGAARGLIFAPQTVPEGARGALQAAGFRRVVHFGAGGNET